MARCVGRWLSDTQAPHLPYAPGTRTRIRLYGEDVSELLQAAVMLKGDDTRIHASCDDTRMQASCDDTSIHASSCARPLHASSDDACSTPLHHDDARPPKRPHHASQIHSGVQLDKHLSLHGKHPLVATRQAEEEAGIGDVDARHAWAHRECASTDGGPHAASPERGQGSVSGQGGASGQGGTSGGTPPVTDGPSARWVRRVEEAVWATAAGVLCLSKSVPPPR